MDEANVDNKGNQKSSNVTKRHVNATKKLKQRVDRGEAVIMPTDKSGKWSIMSLETYENMGQVHIKNDKIITNDDVKKIQRKMNQYNRMFLKVFSVGEAHGERNIDRIRSAFTSNACDVPVLWLMPKDHKPIKEGKQHEVMTG